MRRRTEDSVETPIASLIDVVFLLIIFFVVTASVEKDIVDDTIKLAQAKHAKAVETKQDNTITINLHDDGSMNIACHPVSKRQLKQLLKAAVAKSGNTTPVLIRGDAETLFREIDGVMEDIGSVGLYRVKIAAEVTH